MTTTPRPTRTRPSAPRVPRGARAVRLLPALLGLLVAAGCDDAAGPDGLAAPADEIVVAFGVPTDAYPDDDWDLVAGAVDGDTLELSIRHAGGCRDHEYRLLAVGGWTPLQDAGPTPTYGVGLRLSHDAHGDGCEALLSPTLRFGLEPLRAAYLSSFGPVPGRLLLQITDGRDGFAIYIFEWRPFGG